MVNDGAKLSLRERKKVQTRDALVASAMELFDERGYDATTIDEIAAAANYSPSTFFRYFAAKEDVVFFNHADQFDSFCAALAQRDRIDSPASAVRTALLTVLNDAGASGEMAAAEVARVKLIYSDPALRAREAELFAAWELRMLQEWDVSEDSGVGEELRARVQTAAMMAAVRTALQLWVAKGGRVPLADLINAALDLVDPSEP